MRKPFLVAIVAAISLPCIAAATHRAPGMWQVTTSMHFTEGGIQIPPAMRKQVE